MSFLIVNTIYLFSALLYAKAVPKNRVYAQYIVHQLYNQKNNIVEEWLKYNKIYYDKLIFSKEKLEICKKYNINIMIEDKKENINSISKSIPVICFHENHNKELKSKNIYRAYSWYDVYYKYLIIKERIKDEENNKLS